MFKNKKILVTGSTGFVGSHIVRRLVDEGADVYAMVRCSSNVWRLRDVLGDITFRTSNLSDFSRVRWVIQELRPDGVFHLGAAVIVQGVVAESETIMAVNYGGTKNLLKSLDSSCKFFVNTSTFYDTYGADEYAKSKLRAVEFCSEFGKKNQTPVVTLRLCAPYGPYIKHGRLIADVLVGVLKGVDIKMSSPVTTRDFTFIDDLVDLYFSAAEKASEYPGEVFNAGNGVSTTLKEVADTALAITGSKSKIIWGELPVLPYDSGAVRVDISKTTSCLGWRPTTDLATGLQKTCEWLEENLGLYRERL